LTDQKRHPAKLKSPYKDILDYYSTDDGNTWSNLLPINPFAELVTGLQSSLDIGPYFRGDLSTATTEIHLGNLVALGIPDTTVQISNGYAGASGKTVTIYFESFSGRGLCMTIS